MAPLMWQFNEEMYFRIPLNNWQLLHPPTWPFFKLRVVTVCGYVKSSSPWRRKSKSRLICAVQQITVKRIDYGFPPPTTSTVNIVIVSWMRCHAGFIIGYYSLHGNVLCKRFHHTSTATTSSITTWAFPLSSPVSLSFSYHSALYLFYTFMHPHYANTRDRVNANTPRYFIFTGYKAGCRWIWVQPQGLIRTSG